MASDNLQHNDMMVDALRQAIRAGDAGLKDVPGLVKKVVKDNCWQHRHVHQIRRDAKFDDFIKFIEAYPPEGLGATYDILWRLCGDDEEAQTALDATVKKNGGGQFGNRNAVKTKTTFDNIQGRLPAPTGTSKAAALRRLRKFAPKLHEKVITGEMSANAAMIQAGFRREPTSLEKAQKLWQKMTAKERAAFQKWMKAQ